MDDYTILGAGAIGGLLAVHLAARGRDPLVVDADAAHVEAINARGMTVVHPDGRTATTRLSAAVPESAGDRPLRGTVLVAVKSHALDRALSWLSVRLARDASVVVCQNGDGHLRAAAALGASRVVPGLINFAADRIGPGVISVGGPGELAFGEADGTISGRVVRLCEDFEGFGAVRVTDNISGLIWSKRVLAVLLSATATADDAIADLIDRHRPVMIELAREAIAIARSEGARPEIFDGIDWEALDDRPEIVLDAAVRFLRSVPGKTRSGVFRDLEAGRTPTEASYELGRLVETADRAGIGAPGIRRLRLVIIALETGRIPFDETYLHELFPTTIGSASGLATE